MKKFLVESTAWNDNKWQGYRLTIKKVYEASSELAASDLAEAFVTKMLVGMCNEARFPGDRESIQRESKVTPL